jgi:hypothetical protein
MGVNSYGQNLTGINCISFLQTKYTQSINKRKVHLKCSDSEDCLIPELKFPAPS